jgi:hypothetical protein
MDNKSDFTGTLFNTAYRPIPRLIPQIPSMASEEMPAHPSLEMMVSIPGMPYSALPDSLSYGRDGEVAKIEYSYSDASIMGQPSIVMGSNGRPRTRINSTPGTASTQVSILEDGSIRLTDILTEKLEKKTKYAAELFFRKEEEGYAVFQEGCDTPIANAAALLNQCARTIIWMMRYSGQVSNPALKKTTETLADAANNLYVNDVAPSKLQLAA